MATELREKLGVGCYGGLHAPSAALTLGTATSLSELNFLIRRVGWSFHFSEPMQMKTK